MKIDSKANKDEVRPLVASPIASTISHAMTQTMGRAEKSENAARVCLFPDSLPSADPAPSTCFVAGVGTRFADKFVDSQTRASEGAAGLKSTKPTTNDVGFSKMSELALTDRDRTLLRLCYEQKFLLMEHVQSFFPGTANRPAQIRIKRLTDEGYFIRDYFSELGNRSLYRLGKRGEKVALSMGERHRKEKRLNPTTVVHDALVTSCRLRLLEFWNTQFVPERAIKTKDYPEIPDGIFFFQSGRGIALEVENSDKGRSRFLRLLERWKETPSIVFVLYVAGNERIFSSIKRYLSGASENQPCGVVLWDALRAQTPRVITPRGELDLFGNREI